MNPARLSAVVFLLATPLFAQAPDATLFQGDAKAIALHCADQALVFAPKDAEIQAKTGAVHLATGDRAKAESCFAAAEARKPGNGDVLRLIARGWLKNGFQKEALAAYGKVLQQAPKDKGALTDSAVDLMDAHLDKEAAPFMAQVFQNDPKDEGGFMVFGRACVRAGKLDQASTWFQRAALVKPRDEGTWQDIAMALADNGLEH